MVYEANGGHWYIDAIIHITIAIVLALIIYHLYKDTIDLFANYLWEIINPNKNKPPNPKEPDNPDKPITDRINEYKPNNRRMSIMMTSQQKMELIMMAYRAIFTSRRENLLGDLNGHAVNIALQFRQVLGIRGRLFKDSTTGEQNIPGFDVSVDVGEINPDGTMKPMRLRFIAQNPNKHDGFGNLKENAILARQGHRIMWIINQDLTNGFLGKVIDDVWQPSMPRATYPANQNANYPNPRQAVDQNGMQYNMNQGNWVANLPDLNQEEIAEAVVEAIDKDNGDNECQFIME